MTRYVGLKDSDIIGYGQRVRGMLFADTTVHVREESGGSYEDNGQGRRERKEEGAKICRPADSNFSLAFAGCASST